jgi:Ser/Thr protein kinase RdoA (MazF antagonist)
MARLQNHAAGWQPPPGFTRSRVDNLGALERGLADASDPAVAERAVHTVAAVTTPEAAAVVAAAIRRVWAAMEELGSGADVFGLMHADLHHRNFLFHNGSVGAIDFEDCGYGHWLYDFAVPLTALRGHPDYRALRQALLTGYRRHRPLSAEHERLLDSFMALRTLQDLLGAIEVKDQPAFQEEWEASVANTLQELRPFVHR